MDHGRLRRVGARMESDMVNPRVTVLMPVYDPPLDMLQASVASVLGQTFEDFGAAHPE